MSDSDSCEPCSAFTSSAAGASACGACAVGYFRRVGRAASTANCEVCPVGAVCPWNTTVETLQVQLGYWRLSPFAPILEKCETIDNVTACRGGLAAGDLSCAPGHTAPRCVHCANDRQYFQEGLCRDCPKGGGSIGAAIGIFIFILLVLSLLCALHMQTAPRWDTYAIPLRLVVHNVREFSQSIGLIAKLKVALAFTQVVAQLDSTYNIGMPSHWFEWTEALRFFGEVDWIGWVVPSHCVVGSGIIQGLLLRGLSPLVLIGVVQLLSIAIFVTLACLRPGGTPASTSTSKVAPTHGVMATGVCTGLMEALPVALVLAFCFTPSVSAYIFRAWHCLSFTYDDQIEHSYLARDLSVRRHCSMAARL